MNSKTIFLFAILALTACNNSSSDEYELSDELKERALAVKQEMLEGKVPEYPENKVAPGDNQENSPTWVLKQVFKAARTGDFGILNTLCDPIGELDKKTNRLCEVASTPQKAQEDFMQYFKLGKIASDAVIEGDKASVDITFGYDSTAEATIGFVKRNGKWYMASFV